MANHLLIERPTKKDIESIHNVFEKSITDAFEKEGLSHLREDILSEIEYKKKLLSLALSNNDMTIFFLIAKIKDEVVGTISFSPCGDLIKNLTHYQISNVGELGTLYVLPSYQDKGIGSALIDELIKVLHMNDVQQFCLDSGYKRAQNRWLRKFGHPYKIVKDYWRESNHHMIWVCEVKDYVK